MNYIDSNSNFMKLNNDTSFERLKSFVSKKVYIDIKELDGIVSYYARLTNIDNNKITLNDEEKNMIYTFNISDVLAIDEIKNYNTKQFDLKNIVGNIVELTDMNNNTEIVKITDYDDIFVTLTFNFKNSNGEVLETEDYEYPICFIKSINIVK